MHIVASDYDGTMYHQGELIGDLIPAIEMWRAAGNVFGIATGRDYPMIRREVERWQIPLDFIVCLNGAFAVDASGRELFRHYLDDAHIPAICRHPAAAESLHIQLSGDGPTRVFLRPASWFPKTDLEFEEISYHDALAATTMGQISLSYPTLEACREWEYRLRDDFAGVIATHPNKISIDLNRAGVDKAQGVADLIAANGWQEHPVSVIGDGINDIGMIVRFGGFTVPGAQNEVAAAARKVYANVGEMLKELTNIGR